MNKLFKFAAQVPFWSVLVFAGILGFAYVHIPEAESAFVGFLLFLVLGFLMLKGLAWLDQRQKNKKAKPRE